MGKAGKGFIKSAKQALEYAKCDAKMKDLSNRELAEIVKSSRPGSMRSRAALDNLLSRNEKLRREINNRILRDQVEKAIRDYEAGNTLTLEELWKEFDDK